MLDSNLIVKTYPKAISENVVNWKNYRITVLADRLFRLERSEEKKFRDKATQSVWFRNMPKQNFFVYEIEGKLYIKTDKVTLIVSEERKDCRLSINGEEKTISNSGNLFGTYRTLDCWDGAYFCEYGLKERAKKISLDYGVCSKTGIAVINDENSLTLEANGEVVPEKGNGTDEYIFVYGKDYREAVKALYMICGPVPMVPRYALGNWWSRYYVYTDKEYLRLLNRFSDREIPLTVATIDMDWHYSTKIVEEKGLTEENKDKEATFGNQGWTGYSWNKNLFPDYKQFLKEIEKKNLKITLNEHPADGIRWWEDRYEEMAAALNIDTSDKKKINFDITSTDYINNYFKILLRPYENDGVSFWWIDWQQGTTSQIEGLDPLWSLNHYHYLENAANHDVPLILSRYSGIGSHRYPVGFSGDTIISWDTLKYLPYFTLTASNVGYTWWSHDIGGHMMGEMNEELYLRQIQFGVFSPINRLHCSDAVTTTKEPWFYKNGSGLIAEEFLRLRHKMIPFLYSCDYRTHKDGLALIEPLYYNWQDSKEAYKMQDEYLFGGELIVAPVTTPLDPDGYARTNVWLPAGKWTDIFTGDEYEIGEKGKTKTMLRRLESIPVLAKEGAIIPLSLDKGNYAGNPDKLEIDVYNGNGEFTLFEDGSEQKEIKGDAFTDFVAEFNENDGEKVQKLTITSRGKIKVIPKDRTLRVVFKNVKPEGKITVLENGKHIVAEELIADFAAVEFKYNPKKKYEVSVSYVDKTALEKLIVRAQNILCSSRGNNDVKYWHTYKPLLEAKTVKDFVSIIKKSGINEEAKEKILEIL